MAAIINDRELRMSDPSIIIWGAGKIGRGFIGDLFSRAGYRITFVDADKRLTKELGQRASYTVYNLRSEKDQEKVSIDGFRILHTDEESEVMKALMETRIMAVAVFPGAFEDTAERIARHIEARRRNPQAPPLDIILCANIHHPEPQFRRYIEAGLSEEGKKYLRENIGIAESLIIRMAVEPAEDMLREDPFVVMTNGYRILTVDGTALKNEAPKVEGIRLTENIAAEEIRKMYTYNMVHGVYAYLGKLKNLTTVIEAIQDNTIQSVALGALEEISRGLQSEFGFTEEEMRKWNREVLENMANPIFTTK
jgi:mannitol-1-phosphate 5-dehydrogenase